MSSTSTRALFLDHRPHFPTAPSFSAEPRFIAHMAPAAIVVAILLTLAILVGGYFLSRRLYRQRKEKQRTQIIHREFDLDFDTNDLEIGSMKPRHIRTLSDSSDTPLIEPMHNKRTLRLPSTTSSDSEIYFVPTQSYDAKFRSDGPEPPIPISKEPPPPPSLTTAEHQLTALVSRPSYLAKPRRAPRPGSRGLQGAHDTLKRLTSTRSKKRSRSVDDADSPSSVYSQMSAAPAAYHSFADLPSAFIGEHVPPVPPLPTQYQQRPLGAGVWQQGVPPETTATSAEASRGSEMGSEISSPLPLEDSHAFPLPVVNDPSSPNAQWFSTLWANPSGTASPLSDFSPSNRSTVYSRYSNVLGVRSLEVSSGMPQYNSGSQGEARKGTVGYQLPLNWRRENALTAMSALQR